jgi:murein DD-endopeptidase MepM/ murein hydrolase activator NlpD
MKRLLIIGILVIILILLGIFLDKKTVPKNPENKTPEPVISILPETIFPGDPILVSVSSSSTPKEILFDNKKLTVFNYNGKANAFIGIDFNEKNFEHNIKVTLNSGEIINQKIILTPREKIEKPLGIPDKLGGNTPAAEKALLANLAKENAILNTVKTSTTTLWSKAFVDPLVNIKITDDYGYDRKTGDSTIVHKGTDLHAVEGTQVMAMNDGVVRIARTFIIYGNAVIIDHGQGVQTLYMHLSKMNVKAGDMVKRGQIIGLSGKTGYAESPHLHISVKINSISIDPMTFLSFFK